MAFLIVLFVKETEVKVAYEASLLVFHLCAIVVLTQHEVLADLVLHVLRIISEFSRYKIDDLVVDVNVGLADRGVAA